MEKRKCRVIVLDTKKHYKSRNIILKDSENLLHLTASHNEWEASAWRTSYKTCHMYICSNEDIKEGDWVIRNNAIEQCNSGMHSFALWGADSKKIIATTDESLKAPFTRPAGVFRDLIKPLPEIDESFLLEYCRAHNKNGTITEVMVDYEIATGILFKIYEEDPVKLKLTNNTISISKVKDSWNREEIDILLSNFAELSQKGYINSFALNKFKEENL